MLMGFDAHGHCFMFANGGCSIYSHRPETCRTYDCRVFTAAGMNAGPDKSVINERIASWRFEYPSPRDHEEHRAVTAAANFIRQHPIRFPGGHVPSRPSEIAVLAVKSYQVFLDKPATDAEIAAAIVAACRDFDGQLIYPGRKNVKISDSSLRLLALLLIGLAAGPEIGLAVEMTTLLEILGAVAFFMAFSIGMRMALTDLAIALRDYVCRPYVPRMITTVTLVHVTARVLYLGIVVVADRQASV